MKLKRLEPHEEGESTPLPHCPTLPPATSLRRRLHLSHHSTLPPATSLRRRLHPSHHSTLPPATSLRRRLHLSHHSTLHSATSLRRRLRSGELGLLVCADAKRQCCQGHISVDSPITIIIGGRCVCYFVARPSTCLKGRRAIFHFFPLVLGRCESIHQ